MHTLLVNILQFSFPLSYTGPKIILHTFLSKIFNCFLSLFVSVQVSLSVMDGVSNKSVENHLSTPCSVNSLKCFLSQTACLSVVTSLLWDMEVTTNFFPVFSFSIA